MKVFVNFVDQFTGRAIGKLLSSSIAGATAEPEDDEEDEEGSAEKPEPQKYTVIGSLSSPDAVKPEFVSEVVSNEDRSVLYEAIEACDVIIYDIARSESQAQEAEHIVSKLRDAMDGWDGQKTFICVSSVLTWANTKPIDPDDPEAAFLESDYRKRRTHKNYKSQIDAEKVVYKCGKKTGGKFTAVVVCSGVTYGEGEDALHTLFRQAWELKTPSLPIYGNGEAFLPLIHVADLANIVLHVIEGHADSTRYVLAVDEAQSTLAEIVNALATTMGPGKAEAVDVDEAFLQEEVTQVTFDFLTLNLKMEPGVVAELPFDWVSREGLVENLPKIIAHYKKARHLEALKISVYGPPASGKSTLCSTLAKQYKVLHITRDYVTSATVEMMRASAAILDNPPDGVDLELAEADKEMLLELDQTSREEGKYNEEQMLSLFKRQLNSPACRNQGYILDAYPVDEETAKQLFEPAEEEEADEEDEDEAAETKMPDFVFMLDAADEPLRDRVLGISQEEAEDAHLTQEGFEEQLKTYRANTTEDTTILNFFDFYDILAKHIDAIGNDAAAVASQASGAIGDPHNYGPTKEEQIEIDRLAAELKAKNEAEEARKKAEEDAIEEARRQGAQAVWEAKMAAIRADEQEALDEAALPLRTFLMRHVMPTLTEGLMEVCKVKPEDPVDYLAEFLFKNNPQIE